MTVLVIALGLSFGMLGCKPSISGQQSAQESAGQNSANLEPEREGSLQLKDLEQKLSALALTQEEISAMINSDFSSCSTTGDAKDPLINKLCQVAQASTIETRTVLKGELATFAITLADDAAASFDEIHAGETGIICK